MKTPKYLIDSVQAASDEGIIPFALQLLAETFSDNPDRFGDDNVVLVFGDHENRPVYMILTKTRPSEKDFEA